MKYFLVAGEASGDLHASNLMRELLALDPEAEFRFFGGDRMQSVGGTLLKHHREMAFMGVLAVVRNAGTILRNLKLCHEQLLSWKPDVLILVDYASFNLRIASFAKKNCPGLPVHFYISPKIWAWKEYRIRSFRRHIDKMFVILPFETEFFAKHSFPVTFVGNPSVDSVQSFLDQPFDETAFRSAHCLDERPILALLPGSRKSEIHGNLPLMLEAAVLHPEFQPVVAGAPGQDLSQYDGMLPAEIPVLFGETYTLLRIAHTALVTSGTATLETALFNVPQVVCFHVGFGPLPNLIFKIFMHVRYFSLVNLIANRDVVTELMGMHLTLPRLEAALKPLLADSPERRTMLEGYRLVQERLGETGAARRTARGIIGALKNIEQADSF